MREGVGFAFETLVAKDLSIAEGARAARDITDDGFACDLLLTIAGWGSAPGSEERAFSRPGVESEITRVLFLVAGAQVLGIQSPV